MASTAQEVLIAELLGDIGRLHDQVKTLPAGIKGAIAPAVGELVSATKEAQASIATLVSEKGKAAVAHLEAEAARLRTDLQREHATHRDATKHALAEMIGNEIASAASMMRDGRRSIMGPVWIASIGSGIASGIVVVLATSLI